MRTQSKFSRTETIARRAARVDKTCWHPPASPLSNSPRHDNGSQCRACSRRQASAALRIVLSISRPSRPIMGHTARSLAA